MSVNEELRQAAIAELERRKQLRQNPVETEAHGPVSDSLRRAAIAELERRKALRSSETVPQSEFNWPTAIVEAGGRGLLSLPDFLQHIAVSGSEAGRKSLLSAGESLRRSTGRNESGGLSEAIQEPITGPNWQPSDIVPSTQIPMTPGQRIGMNAAETAGAFALPFGGAARIGKNIATGLGVGAGSGALKEAGAPPLAADIAALSGGILGPGMVKRAFRPRGLSSEEKKVAETLQGLVGERELPAVAENLKAPGTVIPGYEHMTAELANNPSISQIHRARLGIPGSGIQNQASRQNEAIMSKLEEQSIRSALPSEIKENVSKELQARESSRRNATKPGYEHVEKMQEKIEPNHLIRFLEEKPAAGTIKKDLDSIRKELGPESKVTKSDLEYKNLYEKSSSDFKKKMPVPESSAPKVSKLSAIDSDLSAKIEKLTNSGQKKRATILRQAQDALRKDLDIIEPYKEARNKYAELSKPVNEITQHPTLKGIPKSKVNNIMNELYNKKSEDNMIQLKKVLGKNPEEWQGIQHATTKHLKKRVMNAQSEGRSHVLSYPKMKRFMDSHEKALESVYTKDQMQVIKSIESALEGQNIAKTLGQGIGSDTQAKQAIERMLAKGLDIKGLEYAIKGASYPLKHIPIAKHLRGALVGSLELVAKSNEKKLVEILDRSLREPEYAHKLLTHEFKSPSDIKKFFHTSIPASSVISVDIGYKKKRKEDERRK